jgi:hypothetical protein
MPAECVCLGGKHFPDSLPEIVLDGPQGKVHTWGSKIAFEQAYRGGTLRSIARAWWGGRWSGNGGGCFGKE